MSTLSIAALDMPAADGSGLISAGSPFSGVVSGALAVAGNAAVTGNLNVAGSGGITIGGFNAINVGNTTGNAVFIGAHAGENSNVYSNTWDIFIGVNAGQTTASVGQEVVAIGSWACRYLTTGFHNTAVGQTALMTETTGTANVAVGTDCMRGTAGNVNTTAIGSDSAKYGATNACVAVGAQALSGNSSNITVGGTATAGDLLQVTFAHASIPGSPVTVSYTVLNGQTTTQMAVGLSNAIIATTALSGLISGSTGHPITSYTNTLQLTSTIGVVWAGTGVVGPLQPTVTVAVVGAGTETLTLVGGPSGNFNNIAIGYRAMFGTGLSTGHNNICVGTSVGQAITTATTNVFIGASCAQAHTTGASNVVIGYNAMNAGSTSAAQNVIIGQSAGNAVTTATGNVILGAQAGVATNGAGGSNVLVGFCAGAGITSGFNNIVIGPSASAGTVSATQVTTGANNISIGNNVAVASQTANNQLCIGNFIYGTTLSGTNATISTAKIGLGIKAPAVELDVVGTINASVAYQQGGTQVVGARSTGWVAITGSTDKGSTYDTSTINLAQLAGRVMALQAALTTHGLIGT